MTSTVNLSNKAFILKKEARDFVFTRSSSVDVNDTDEDVLYGIVNAVCSAVEAYIGSPVINDPALVWEDEGGWPEILLPYWPIIEVSEVTDSVLGDYDEEDYVVSTKRGVVLLADGSDWPASPNFTTVTYEAGLGEQTVDDITGEVTAITGVPDDIRQAGLEWVRLIWRSGPENFTETSQTPSIAIPKLTKGLLEKHKLKVIGIA